MADLVYTPAERAAIALDALRLPLSVQEKLFPSAASAMPPDVTGEAFLAAVRDVLTQEEYAKWECALCGGEWFENLLREYASRGVACVTRFSHTYPAGCLSLPEPPLVLYCEGDVSLLSVQKFGVTGSRRIPPHLEKLAEEYARGIARKFAVVSSSAAGGDSAALRGALESGRAVCVLAEGSLVAGPACNLSLFARIRERGLLVSEFPPSFHAPVYRFSARNRIVAALSDVLLVVSAGSKSGTLITADLVHKLGRTVYAVPCSPGVAAGEGCNALLKEYAKCTDKLVDIAAAFGINLTETEPVPLSEREQSVLELLRGGPAHSAALAEKLGLQPQETIVLLTLLEMKGKVVSLGGNRYSLV